MSNTIALIVIVLFGAWIREYFVRKREEQREKERNETHRFLQNVREWSPPVAQPSDPLPGPPVSDAADHFRELGYTLSEYGGERGIDLIGIKDNTLIMILCLPSTQEGGIDRLKRFVADTTLQFEQNPVFARYTLLRCLVTTAPFSHPDVSEFIAEYPRSLTHRIVHPKVKA